MKPSSTTCPASVPVSVEFWPEASSASAKTHAGRARAEQRREQLVGILDRRDVLVARPMKHRRGEDEDGGVDQQREHEREAPESMLANRIASRRPAGVFSKARVCTMAEWR